MTDFADRAHVKRRGSEKPCPTCYSLMEPVYERGKLVAWICPRHGRMPK